MKSLKKLLASALSLVVLCGALIAFTGCSEVQGKSYAYEGLTYTIITGVDAETDPENPVVTETKTLTAREYWLHKISERKVKIEDLAAATLSEAEEKAFALWLKGEELIEEVLMLKNTTIEFSGKKVKNIILIVDEITGEGGKMVREGTYTDKDGVLTLEYQCGFANEDNGEDSYQIMKAYIVNDKVETRVYEIDDAEDYAKGELFYTSVVYAEVK